MNRVIVVGSPRVNGRSASLADQLLYACIEEYPDDVVSIVSVASTQVEPCRGCDACAQLLDEAPSQLEEGDPLSPHPLVAKSDAALHACIIGDDMAEVRKHLDAADELIVISPVYFAGAPAQFKAMLDRFQPYFHSDVRTRGKRPMVLHVVGEGGDPHGFDPLVGTVASAFSVAGFRLEAIFDWVGKIDADGTLAGEPQEYVLAPEGAEVERGQTASSEACVPAGLEPEAFAAAGAAGARATAEPSFPRAPRDADGKPKLSLSSSAQARGRSSASSRGSFEGSGFDRKSRGGKSGAGRGGKAAGERGARSAGGAGPNRGGKPADGHGSKSSGSRGAGKSGKRKGGRRG